MSVLSSTGSGMSRALTPSSIITMGFSQKDGDGTIGVYVFYCSQDKNLKLKYHIKDGRFMFEMLPTMRTGGETEMYTDVCVIKTLGDLKLLKDWWFCEDIHEKTCLEKLILELREFSMNDVLRDASEELSRSINEQIVNRIKELSAVPKASFDKLSNYCAASPLKVNYTKPNFVKTVWKPR